MFEEQSGLPNQIELEKGMLKFWQEQQIFEKLRERNRGKPRFSFLDGPITANNSMGVHHAWGRTLKDIYQRYWAMHGRELRYQNGFDCQGLWVEVEVERELGFTNKRDIESYGIAEFIERCKERVARFSQIITDESIRLGCWMDWEHSYYTHSDGNNYAIWHFLKKCHERGFIYAGTDVMPWCPRCGTGLSQQEMAEGYKEVVHPGVVARLPLKERSNEFLLVWTTTPWTLTANVACAVHPDLSYIKVRQDDKVYYLASARKEEILKSEPPWQVEGEVAGSELVGLAYLGPFDDLPQAREAACAHRVIPWKEISETEGTGIVHIAPGCGKEDYELGKEQSLPIVAPIDEHGKFLAGAFAGLHASDSADAVISALRERGMLYRVDNHRHSYPHCWRCGSELLFRLVDEWFIAMDQWRQEIIQSAEAVQWVPTYGRELELDWLRNMRDWMISKKRYWGLALPIWRCDCGWFDVIGSREELQQKALAGWEQFEGHSPHRPWIDKVKIKCQQCGTLVNRVSDVGNPWLDAGIVPYSTMGYFDARKEWAQWFPADLIIECLQGQFRNWFYALLAMSAMLEGRAPFRTLVGHSVVVDEQGEEMHKSKGNAVWFSQAADAMGADIVRWLCASQPLGQPFRFGLGRAEEANSWLRTLWNVYSFFTTYANVDGWPRATSSARQTQPESALDCWLKAKLAATTKEVSLALESFNPPRATAALLALVDDLSNWWVRRSRRRFWKSGSDADKEAAYQTLHLALLELCRLLAPFMPFTAEALYQRLVTPFCEDLPESVHLNAWPESVDAGDEEKVLLDECALARDIVRLGRAARSKAGIRVRQPLARVMVYAPDILATRSLSHFENDVKEELNVKAIEFVSHRESLGAVLVEDGELAVGLEANLTDELKLEGLARDLVRHIQTLRKQAGLQVGDRIELWIDAQGSDEIERAIKAHEGYIAGETLAEQIHVMPIPGANETKIESHVGGKCVIFSLKPA